MFLKEEHLFVSARGYEPFLALVYLDPVKPVPEVTVAFDCEGGVDTRITLHSCQNKTPSLLYLILLKRTSSWAEQKHMQ